MLYIRRLVHDFDVVLRAEAVERADTCIPEPEQSEVAYVDEVVVPSVDKVVWRLNKLGHGKRRRVS